MPPDLHVVFGAGQVGALVAQMLIETGHAVRVVKRSPGNVPAGAETRLGDARNIDFCAEAAAGATVLYHCMNPPYRAKDWAVLVPQYMTNLITAAGRTGARLVVLDNLYPIGTTGGRPIDEDTPFNPRSRKGEIRAEAAALLFDAHRQGGIHAVAGRASDFYGPGGFNTHFGKQFWEPVLAGRKARMLIDPGAVHTYHYIPDVAAGLAALGQAEDAVLGTSWMLPCTPAQTARDLVAGFSRVLGREIPVMSTPRWLTKAIGWFVPIVREVGEMLYQWDEPFVVDDRRFRARFGIEPTDPQEAAEQTVAWARRAFHSLPTADP